MGFFPSGSLVYRRDHTAKNRSANQPVATNSNSHLGANLLGVGGLGAHTAKLEACVGLAAHRNPPTSPYGDKTAMHTCEPIMARYLNPVDKQRSNNRDI